jgi:hypothetical protein
MHAVFVMGAGRSAIGGAPGGIEARRQMRLASFLCVGRKVRLLFKHRAFIARQQARRSCKQATDRASVSVQDI